MVTLGSPHQPPPVDSPVAALDQTRGLLTYINSCYPGIHRVSYVHIHHISCCICFFVLYLHRVCSFIGAYEPGVEYITIGGSSVTGQSPLTRPEKSAIEPEKSATRTKVDLSDQLQQYLAAGSYYFLCGDSGVKGDGMYIYILMYIIRILYSYACVHFHITIARICMCILLTYYYTCIYAYMYIGIIPLETSRLPGSLFIEIPVSYLVYV